MSGVCGIMILLHAVRVLTVHMSTSPQHLPACKHSPFYYCWKFNKIFINPKNSPTHWTLGIHQESIRLTCLEIIDFALQVGTFTYQSPSTYDTFFTYKETFFLTYYFYFAAGLFDDLLNKDIPRKQRQSVDSSPCHSKQSSEGNSLVSSKSGSAKEFDDFDCQLKPVEDQKVSSVVKWLFDDTQDNVKQKVVIWYHYLIILLIS